MANATQKEVQADSLKRVLKNLKILQEKPQTEQVVKSIQKLEALRDELEEAISGKPVKKKQEYQNKMVETKPAKTKSKAKSKAKTKTEDKETTEK